MPQRWGHKATKEHLQGADGLGHVLLLVQIILEASEQRTSSFHSEAISSGIQAAVMG